MDGYDNLVEASRTMPYEYYAENHDWDMTLRASRNLVMAAQAAKENRELSFSFLTGGMLLAFCAVENLLDSIAFQMSRDTRFDKFSYAKYHKLNGVWEKIRIVCFHIGIECDQTKDPFMTFETMRRWRIALVHAKPYSIETSLVEDSSETPKLHLEFMSQEYTKSVSLANAKIFYQCAFDLIDLLRRSSGLDPRAMCSYKVI